jgi:hypothetical protein
MTDPTAAIEVWARMLCAADVHVHGADHPTWQQLVGEPGSKIRDDYRKAAAWLLPRLTVAATPAGPAPAPDRNAVPTDEDFLVATEEALESTLLPSPGVSVLERTLDAVTGALAPLVAQLRAAVLPAPTDRAALHPAPGETWRPADDPGDHVVITGVSGTRVFYEAPADKRRRRPRPLQLAAEMGEFVKWFMPSEAQQDPTQDGEAGCGNPGHRAHPGFSCAEVDQTRPFWEGRWADTTPARSGQPETDPEARRD